jgi:hypothetical protein
MNSRRRVSPSTNVRAPLILSFVHLNERDRYLSNVAALQQPNRYRWASTERPKFTGSDSFSGLVSWDEHKTGFQLMKRSSLLASLFALAMATPALAFDYSIPSGLSPDVMKNITKDITDLNHDLKDIRTDRAALEALKDAGKGDSTLADKYRVDIAKDRLDIHNDFKDLKHDGVTITKNKH